MDLVPTIDIEHPSQGDLRAVDLACRDHGFFLLEGHGLDDLIERTWTETHRFFDAPRRLREDIRRTEDQPLGWYDRELTKRFRDCKEVFDYMHPAGAIGEIRNRWPDSLPGFRGPNTNSSRPSRTSRRKLFTWSDGSRATSPRSSTPRRLERRSQNSRPVHE